MNYRGFTGKRYKIKGMQGLGPILLTARTPPAVTWSWDISVLHRQIHGLWETTGSGHTRMVLQARVATREAFEAAFVCDLRKHLCVLQSVLVTSVNTLKHLSDSACAKVASLKSSNKWILLWSTKVSLFHRLPLYYKYSQTWTLTFSIIPVFKWWH